MKNKQTGDATALPDECQNDAPLTKPLTIEKEKPSAKRKGSTNDTKSETNRHGDQAEDLAGGGKKKRGLNDLTVAMFEEFAKDEAPGTNVLLELERFKDYCRGRGKRYKDYEAAFRNWLRKAQEWWEERHPKGAGSDGEKVAYGDFTPDSSPAREAYREAYKAWQQGGREGEPPKLEAFEHLNQQRGANG